MTVPTALMWTIAVLMFVAFFLWGGWGFIVAGAICIGVGWLI